MAGPPFAAYFYLVYRHAAGKVKGARKILARFPLFPAPLSDRLRRKPPVKTAKAGSRLLMDDCPINWNL